MAVDANDRLTNATDGQTGATNDLRSALASYVAPANRVEASTRRLTDAQERESEARAAAIELLDSGTASTQELERAQDTLTTAVDGTQRAEDTLRRALEATGLTTEEVTAAIEAIISLTATRGGTATESTDDLNKFIRGPERGHRGMRRAAPTDLKGAQEAAKGSAEDLKGAQEDLKTSIR